MRVVDNRKSLGQESRELFESLSPGTIFEAYSIATGKRELYMKIKEGIFFSKRGSQAEAVCLNQDFRLCTLDGGIDYGIVPVKTATLTLE